MTSLLFSFLKSLNWNQRRIIIREFKKLNKRQTDLWHVAFLIWQLAFLCSLLELGGKYFMVKILLSDRSTSQASDETERREERSVVLGVVIVCSLSVFYVTTTHSFSSTYGEVPGICFLSLFLMTWVTSLTLHMLRRGGPAAQGSEPLKDGCRF